ncbi:hypothetical protein KOI35_32305 [Actinoplanes bogorensis]|uniref:Uncharacterized protein n=1 Tax=Paractinoplanes bogorensis TaxID=1610840 RepID=A0ABS5Z1D3_9ACTN|nr:hypothetical protein [Actinoplanes bogorensis]MBU2668205.1 hypothetical protein [Actinoplanes bogorensis]
MSRLRQLDLVSTIALALVVGLLGAFDIVGPAITGGATLTTLGLLAAGSLHGRSALAGLTRSVRQLGREIGDHAGADRLLAPSTSGVDLDLRLAADVRIVGVTLARTVRNHYAALQQCLDAGATARIALIAPDETTMAEAARRSTIPDRPEIFEHRLRPTLDLLDALARHAENSPGRLEVRLLDFVPAFGLIAVDPESTEGEARIDIYSHRCGTAEPALPLRADRDHRWFTHFVAEFDRVWTAGRPYVKESA